MTTGRINQVTILSQRAGAQGRLPKESEFTKQGDAEATQVTTLLKPKAILVQATDSIAPTEFPKSWSAASHAQRCRYNISATYSLQEEKTHASSHVRRGNSAELSPKIWWIVGRASNPQTPKFAHQVIEGTSVLIIKAGEIPKYRFNI